MAAENTLTAPYLIGNTQVPYRGLDPTKALDYIKVKTAILDYLDINPETFCQGFQKEKYPPGTKPRVVAQHLKEQCWCWLNPEKQIAVQVAEDIVLEQFSQILPAN